MPVIPPISSTTRYVHNQQVAATTWTVDHNLGRRPSVTVVDSADDVVIGEVRYASDNRVVLTFSSAFSGKAYLN